MSQKTSNLETTQILFIKRNRSTRYPYLLTVPVPVPYIRWRNKLLDLSWRFERFLTAVEQHVMRPVRVRVGVEAWTQDKRLFKYRSNFKEYDAE